MNLDGIRAMKLTNLRPRYILLFPSSDEAYSSILDDHDLSEEERENALATYEEFGNIKYKNMAFHVIISNHYCAYLIINIIIYHYCELLKSGMQKYRIII